MKINRILLASALAGAVLLSATACATQNPDKSSESSTAVQMKTVEDRTAATPAVRAAVAKTVNEYYAYVSDPSNLPEIEKASEPVKDHAKKATNEELNALVDALPTAFKYFDTSSPDLIKNAYAQLTMGARVLSRGKMNLSVPEDAFTVDGDIVTVDVSKTETILNGKKIQAPSNSGMFALKFKKSDAGAWIMIAEPIPGLSSSNSFAAAASGSIVKK